MGLEDDTFTDISRIIILKTEEQGLVGVVVDEVKEVIALTEDDIDRNAQNSQGDTQNYINGIGKNGDELISILELSAILEEGTMS